MKNFSTGNSTVDAMASINLTGNIVPQSWFKTITRDNGKPDLLAIMILSDIAYWYRPIEIRDEGTGQVIKYQKRFKSDMLQRSYSQFSEQLGESKRSVTDAIVRLEALGAINRVFKTIEVGGIKYNNVLYIDLHPDVLYRLTYPDSEEQPEIELTKENTLSRNLGTGVTPNCERGPEITGDLPRNLGRQNTKITTENTTENISSSSEGDDDINLKTYYDAAAQYPRIIVTSLLNEMKKREGLLHSISPPLFAQICDNIIEHSRDIGNISAYIQRCIDNLIAGQKISSAKAAYKKKAEYEFDELEEKIISN